VHELVFTSRTEGDSRPVLVLRVRDCRFFASGESTFKEVLVRLGSALSSLLLVLLLVLLLLVLLLLLLLVPAAAAAPTASAAGCSGARAANFSHVPLRGCLLSVRRATPHACAGWPHRISARGSNRGSRGCSQSVQRHAGPRGALAHLSLPPGGTAHHCQAVFFFPKKIV